MVLCDGNNYYGLGAYSMNSVHMYDGCKTSDMTMQSDA